MFFLRTDGGRRRHDIRSANAAGAAKMDLCFQNEKLTYIHMGEYTWAVSASKSPAAG